MDHKKRKDVFIWNQEYPNEFVYKEGDRDPDNPDDILEALQNRANTEAGGELLSRYLESEWKAVLDPVGKSKYLTYSQWMASLEVLQNQEHGHYISHNFTLVSDQADLGSYSKEGSKGGTTGVYGPYVNQKAKSSDTTSLLSKSPSASPRVKEAKSDAARLSLSRSRERWKEINRRCHLSLLKALRDLIYRSGPARVPIVPAGFFTIASRVSDAVVAFDLLRQFLVDSDHPTSSQNFGGHGDDVDGTKSLGNDGDVSSLSSLTTPAHTHMRPLVQFVPMYADLCSSVKLTVLCVLENVLGKVKRTAPSFQLLVDWSLAHTRTCSCGLEVSPRIVLFFPSYSLVKPEVMTSLVALCSNYRTRIGFVLLFSLSEAALYTLPFSLSRLLALQEFHLPSVESMLDEAVRELVVEDIFSPGLSHLRSQSTLLYLIQSHLHLTPSIQLFTDALEFLRFSHYNTAPLSFLCREFDHRLRDDLHEDCVLVFHEFLKDLENSQLSLPGSHYVQKSFAKTSRLAQRPVPLSSDSNRALWSLMTEWRQTLLQYRRDFSLALPCFQRYWQKLMGDDTFTYVSALLKLFSQDLGGYQQGGNINEKKNVEERLIGTLSMRKMKLDAQVCEELLEEWATMLADVGEGKLRDWRGEVRQSLKKRKSPFQEVVKHIKALTNDFLGIALDTVPLYEAFFTSNMELLVQSLNPDVRNDIKKDLSSIHPITSILQEDTLHTDWNSDASIIFSLLRAKNMKSFNLPALFEQFQAKVESNVGATEGDKRLLLIDRFQQAVDELCLTGMVKRGTGPNRLHALVIL